MFVAVLEDVKVVFSWIFPLKSSHGKPYCNNRLPAERTESESSVPTIVRYSVCVRMCISNVCFAVCVPLPLVWFIFNMHSIRVSTAGSYKNTDENRFGSSDATVIFNLHNTQWACVSVCVQA